MKLTSVIFATLLTLLIPSFSTAGPSYDVYTDSWTSMWGSWSWNVTATPTSARFFKGSASMQVTFNAQWGGFAPGAWHSNGSGGNLGFQTSGYKHLTFAVYNSSNGHNLWLTAWNLTGNPGTALRVNDYTETGNMPVGKWTWVRIPISALGLGSSPTLQSFAFQSGISGAVVNFDEITFGASTTFYEGIQAEKGPSTALWKWGVNVTPISESGMWWLQISPTQAWGGIQLQQAIPVGVVSSDYGSLTIMFLKSVPYQGINVSLINANNIVVGSVALSNAYLPPTMTMQANTWYRVNIPLSHFFSGTVDLAGVAIETDTAATFMVDDVRLIQKFSYPMPSVAKSVSGWDFGDYYGVSSPCDGLAKMHNGIDYFDNQPYGGTAVKAGARGWVKQVATQSGGWGIAVVIQHESGLTTNYLHLDSVFVSVGQEVQRGGSLGVTANLAGQNSHLHFGLRTREFDSSSDTGGLPQVACSPYPAFPASFIDPESMDWQ